MFGLCVVVGFSLGLRVSAVSTSDSLIIRNTFRTYRVKWSDVAAIVDAGPIPYKMTSPAVVLRDRRHPIPIVAMLGWENVAGVRAGFTIKRWGQAHAVETTALADIRRANRPTS